MAELTNRTFVRYSNSVADDRQYLAQLRDYFHEHRVLPSYAKIGALVGMRSKGSVAELVLRLKALRFLESTPDRRLKPGPRFFEREAFRSVQAGTPTAAADVPPESLNIDEYLVSNPSSTVLISVRGDSMIDAGIRNGDRVVVEKRTNANIGEIVVAMVDNEFTVKRFHRENGRIVLRPENKAFPPIRPRGSDEIFGVVVGLIRKYS